MKIFSLLVILGIATPLLGSPEKTNDISGQEIEQITQSGPQEDSPFLIEREDAQAAAARAATNPIYSNLLLRPRHTLQQRMKNFVGTVSRFVKLAPDKNTLPPLQLFLEPSLFSVTDCSELNVTFKIINNKKEMILLDFPTNQRIDIIVKDATGATLLSWSQDRSFDPIPGLVTINPKESVLYTEKIPTSIMKDGSTYTIEDSLAGQSGYNISIPVTPQYSSSKEGFDE